MSLAIDYRSLSPPELSNYMRSLSVALHPGVLMNFHVQEHTSENGTKLFQATLRHRSAGPNSPLGSTISEGLPKADKHAALCSLLSVLGRQVQNTVRSRTRTFETLYQGTIRLVGNRVPCTGGLVKSLDAGVGDAEIVGALLHVESMASYFRSSYLANMANIEVIADVDIPTKENGARVLRYRISAYPTPACIIRGPAAPSIKIAWQYFKRELVRAHLHFRSVLHQQPPPVVQPVGSLVVGGTTNLPQTELNNKFLNIDFNPEE